MSTSELSPELRPPLPEVMAADTPPNQEAMAARRARVIMGAFGANAGHMDWATRKLAAEHPVYGTEYRIPDDLVDPPIPLDRVFRTNTTEGQEQLDALFEKRQVESVYASLIPPLHAPYIKELLGRYARGQLDFMVIPKPVVSNLEERREIRDAVREAVAARREWAIRIGRPELAEPHDSPLYVHEHYQRKESWVELFKRLHLIMNQLGRPERVEVMIEEARTIEAEKREEAFGKGALDDLGPHALSLLLDIAYAINNTDRYAMPNRSPKATVQRLRYEDSKIANPDAETGFVVRGTSQLCDRGENGDGKAIHDVAFTLSGGKGLIDRKEVRITCVRQNEAGVEERNTVVVDLQKNAITEFPDEIRDLLPAELQFKDNGYRDSVWQGLNGGGPNIGFQSWDQAWVVVGMLHDLTKLGQENPLITYKRENDASALSIKKTQRLGGVAMNTAA